MIGSPKYLKKSSTVMKINCIQRIVFTINTILRGQEDGGKIEEKRSPTNQQGKGEGHIQYSKREMDLKTVMPLTYQ